MHKQIRVLLPQLLLTLAALTVYTPNSHAFGSYGSTVNAACLTYNGTQPYTGDCTLCHNPTGSKLIGKTLPFSWWANQLQLPTPLNNFCPPQTNPLPNGVISTPANNATINMGTVAFTATSTYLGTNLPLTYAWNFGGATANSTVQNPSVVLNKAGTFTVTFTVTDSKGFTDPTPATITLVVKDPNANQAPNGTITNPAGNSSINIGTTLGFAGTGIDPDNNTPLTYAWNFGGGTANSTLQNPTVAFATAGIYSVTLTVTDSKGLSDPTPDLRTVTVSTGTTASSCTDQDKDKFSSEGGVCGPKDCNDNNAAINLGAIEICADNIDNDCNALVDKDDPHCKSGDCVAQLLNKIEITSAAWEQDDRKLTVNGPWTTAGDTIKLTDSLTGTVEGTTQSTKSGWSFNLEEVAIAPCRIRVEINGRSGERDVAYAPSNCSGKPAATNKLPVANADSAATTQNVPVNIAVLANDTDPDKDTLSIIVFTQPEHGKVTQNGLILAYMPTSGYSGNDSFTYTLSDGHGGTAKATVRVTIQKAVSIPPIKVVINSATWNSRDKKLLVSGSGGVKSASVKILNATTKATLGTTSSEDNGKWAKTIEKPSIVPCKVRVEITKSTQIGYTEKAVANAPKTCK
ncbi:MAG: PKD domain-containing protein [Methylococcaceae bacterium]